MEPFSYIFFKGLLLVENAKEKLCGYTHIISGKCKKELGLQNYFKSRYEKKYGPFGFTFYSFALKQ